MDRGIYRGLGSIDIAAAARSVLLVGKTQDGTRALVQIKNSLAEYGQALGFEIRQGQFFWTGEVDISVEDLLKPEVGQEGKSAVDEAIDFLREILSSGPVEAKGIMKQAKAAGIAEKTLRRTKDILGVIVESMKNDGGKVVGWRWRLPKPDGQPDGQTHINTFGHLDEEAANPHESSTFTRWPKENVLVIWQESSNDATFRAQKPDGQKVYIETSLGGGKTWSALSKYA
jgi:hypothetical protein